MRIVHLIQSAPEVYGAERCALLELATLRRRGHDAQVVVLAETRMGDKAQVLRDLFAQRGIPVHPVTSQGPVTPQLLWTLGKTLSGLRPDVVHSHGLKTDVLGFLASSALRIPFVVEVHGWLRPEHDRRVRFYEALDRRLLRRCQGVLVLSSEYRDEVSALGVSPRRLHLLPSGIDVEGLQNQEGSRNLRAVLGIPDGVPVIGMVARLSPEKGHGDFLYALAELRARWKSPMALPVGLLVGEGPLKETLIKDAAALGLRLGYELHMPGYVAKVGDAYTAMDVLVSCSRYEGLPLNVLEAMALCRPVVAMATGGCVDIVVSAGAETGVLVKRGDRAGLVLALLDLVPDRLRRKRMGEAGHNRVQAHYSLDAWAQGAERIYSNLLSETGQRQEFPS